jgi:hypothetical protein
VTSPFEKLRRAGIVLAPGQEDVRVECTRIASVLIRRGLKLVGLMPAGPSAAVPAVAIQLGQALGDLTGSPVAVCDIAGSWNAALRHGEGSGPTLFAATWLGDNLAVLTPRTFDTGGVVLKLEQALRGEAAIFAMLLVDLTGLERLGEHVAAMAMVDGVAIVARAGVTGETELRRWLRDVPSERNLGVLLVGA